MKNMQIINVSSLAKTLNFNPSDSCLQDSNNIRSRTHKYTRYSNQIPNKLTPLPISSQKNQITQYNKLIQLSNLILLILSFPIFQLPPVSEFRLFVLNLDSLCFLKYSYTVIE